MSTAKRLYIAAAAAVLLVTAVRYRGKMLQMWEHWRYPPPQGPFVTPMGAEILKARDQQLQKKTDHEFQRIRGKIDEARAQGYSVDFLEPKMTFVSNYVDRGRFEEALFLLNRIEMLIPRKKEAVVAVHAEDAARPKADIKASPIRKKSKHKRKRIKAQEADSSEDLHIR